MMIIYINAFFEAKTNRAFAEQMVIIKVYSAVFATLKPIKDFFGALKDYKAIRPRPYTKYIIKAEG